jgi:phosphate transport system substrate-binding protein
MRTYLSAFALGCLSLATLDAYPVAAEELKIGGTGAALRAMETVGAAFERSGGSRVVALPSLGSRGGKQAVLAGAIDVAVSADPVSATEESQGLVGRMLGRTPFVFVVSAQSPVAGLTSQEAADLYRGKTPTWPDGSRVRPILRPASDSDTTFLRKMSPSMDEAVTEAHARPGMRVAPTDQAIADDVENIPGALGTSTLALVLSERRKLRPLALDGVMPTTDAVARSTYPHSKTIYLITRQPAPAVQRFLDFIRSARGREVLSSLGFVVP